MRINKILEMIVTDRERFEMLIVRAGLGCNFRPGISHSSRPHGKIGAKIVPFVIQQLVTGAVLLNQGWGTLILEGHSPAEFSSNPEKPWEKNT